MCHDYERALYEQKVAYEESDAHNTKINKRTSLRLLQIKVKGGIQDWQSNES